MEDVWLVWLRPPLTLAMGVTARGEAIKNTNYQPWVYHETRGECKFN